MRRLLILGSVLGLLLVAAGSFAQEKPSEPKPTPPVLNPTARLNLARTVFMKNGGGSRIPYDVISSGVEGWGRYKLVGSPEKADLIVEVTSPDSDDGGFSVTSSTSSTSPKTGLPETSTNTTRQVSTGGGRITIMVYDAHNHVRLWMESEQAKSAMRSKARDANLIEAAEKLITKFRQRVEPDPTE